MWRIKIKRKLERKIASYPDRIQNLYQALKRNLTLDGPEQPAWPNYSKLGREKYHCHLTHHYVACWTVLSATELEMEVYYVGSRENAPY